MIGTYAVPDAVKEVLLKNVERFDGTLGARGAKGLAEWAVAKGRKPTPAGLVTIAKAAGSPASSSILTLLGGQTNSLDIESMRASLDALGEPYTQLTQPGRGRPNIPMGKGVEPILRRLQGEGIVSKYDVNDKKGEYKVSKRHA